MTFTRNRLMLAATVVLGLAAVSILSLRGSASAESTVAAPPVVDYTQPTGPELTVSAAAEDVVKFAREAAVKTEVTVEITRSDLARARAVMEGEPVMVDSHTGIREGFQIGGTASVSLAELGTTSTFDFATESSIARAAVNSRSASRLGTIVGTSLVVGGPHGTPSHPAVGERIFLAGSRKPPIALGVTDKLGAVVAHVRAGSGYRLEGRSPMLCRSRVFNVAANRRTSVRVGVRRALTSICRWVAGWRGEGRSPGL
jgi:hypothetical protein